MTNNNNYLDSSCAHHKTWVNSRVAQRANVTIHTRLLHLMPELYCDQRLGNYLHRSSY